MITALGPRQIRLIGTQATIRPRQQNWSWPLARWYQICPYAKPVLMAPPSENTEIPTTTSLKLDSILDALRTSDVVRQPCGNVQAVGFPDRTEFHLSEHHEHNSQPQRYRIQVLRPLIGTSNSNVMSCGRCRFRPRLVFSFTSVQSM